MILDKTHYIKKLDSRNVGVIEKYTLTKEDGTEELKERCIAYCSDFSSALRWGMEFLLSEVAGENARLILERIDEMKRVLLEEVKRIENTRN